MRGPLYDWARAMWTGRIELWADPRDAKFGKGCGMSVMNTNPPTHCNCLLLFVACVCLGVDSANWLFSQGVRADQGFYGFHHGPKE
eukprot:g27922.t1